MEADDELVHICGVYASTTCHRSLTAGERDIKMAVRATAAFTWLEMRRWCVASCIWRELTGALLAHLRWVYVATACSGLFEIFPQEQQG